MRWKRVSGCNRSIWSMMPTVVYWRPVAGRLRQTNLRQRTTCSRPCRKGLGAPVRKCTYRTTAQHMSPVQCEDARRKVDTIWRAVDSYEAWTHGGGAAGDSLYTNLVVPEQALHTCSCGLGRAHFLFFLPNLFFLKRLERSAAVLFYFHIRSTPPPPPPAAATCSRHPWSLALSRRRAALEHLPPPVLHRPGLPHPPSPSPVSSSDHHCEP
jgi:hypothetical protein